MTDSPLSAGIELDELDPDVRPQDDLFRHVNGKWIARTEIPSDKARYGSFYVLAEEAEKAVRAIMHGDGTGNLTALLPAEQAVAAWQTLDHEARCRRADGDDRSIDHLMCDLLVERVTGQTAASDLNLEVGVVIAASSLLAADQQPAKLVGHRGGDHGVLPAGLARQLAHHPSSAGATHTNPLHHVTGHTASSSNSTPTHSPSNTPADTTDNPRRPDAEQG